MIIINSININKTITFHLNWYWGISSHFHDGVPMQRLCQEHLQKRCFEKKQIIRAWHRSLFVWQMLQNVQRKDAYVRHERTCSIICEYCDTEFDSGSDLFIHVQSQDSDKKYMCSKCGKKYSQKQELRKHQQKCTNTVSDFTLQTIINYIKSGVRCIVNTNFTIYILRIGLHDYKTILAVTYSSKLIRLSHIINRHLVFLCPPPPQNYC